MPLRSLLLLLLMTRVAIGQTAPAAPVRSRAAPAGIEMPVLEQFVPAPYPPVAEREGREAEVVLALGIGVDGKVVSVEVKESAGFGFDEAAVAAARRFVFKPARRNGEAVAVKILYRYSFVLTPVEAPAQTTLDASTPPGGAQTPSTGPRQDVSAESSVVDGVVTILGTDVPISDARVLIVGPEGVVAEIQTAADGHWRIAPIAPGKYTISVRADGYDLFSSEEQVAPGEETALVYRLTPVDDAPYDVIVPGVRPAREMTKKALARRELSRIPGTFGDALRGIQSLPGVARPPTLSGLLVVRGTEAHTTSVFVDGVYVPNVYHFGGLSSVVPTEMLEAIEFYPGNFSVRYGRATGGAVEAKLRRAREGTGYHGLAQVDLIDARVMLEGPAPLLPGWRFLAGARRSHVDAWLVPLIEDEGLSVRAAPVYYDYQAFLETVPDPDSFVRFGFFGSDDRFRIATTEGAASGELASGDAFWYALARYEAKHSGSFSSKSTVAAGHFRQKFSLSSIFADSTAETFALRSEFSARLSPVLTLHFGPDVLVAPYHVDLRVPRDTGGAAASSSFVTAPPLVVDESNVYFRPAAYAEFEMKPSARSEVVTGVRVDYTESTRRVDVSPRMTGRYELEPSYPRTAIRSGVGMFHQPPEVAETLETMGNPNLRSPRALHLSVALEQDLSQNIEASIEPFAKWLDQWVARVPAAGGSLRYENLASGSVLGAELLVKFRPGTDFFGWLSYTLSRSTRRWTPNEPSELFYLDQTHVLTAVASYQLGAGWEIGGRCRFVSGNPTTPCEGALFDSIGGAYLCVEGAPLSERLPPFHELDVRIDKRWRFTDWTLSTYLDVVNAYNRVNPDFMAYNFDYTERRPETASLPFIPSVGLRGEF